jgi:hypothetical protein
VAREVMRAYLSAFPILLPFLPTACGQFLNPIARGRYNRSLRPVVRKNEQSGESQAGRGRRGWEQLGEDRGRGSDDHDTSQPSQLLVVWRDQGPPRLLGDRRTHRISPMQVVLGRQRSGLVTQSHSQRHSGDSSSVTRH